MNVIETINGHNKKKNNHSDWESTKDVPFNQDTRRPTMPEVFQRKVDAYEKECASFMDPIVEKLSESDINEIGNAFDYNYEVGYTVAIRVLSDLLNIKEPEIRFKTIERNEDSSPYFHKKEGVIYIPQKKNGDINDRLLINAVDATAHEVWHAYQQDVIQNNGRRAKLYRDNFNNYISVEKDIEGYLSQPIELEAYVFSGKIVDKFFDIRLEKLWKEYNRVKKVIEECKENGNEHLVDVFLEDNKKRMSRLKELTGGEYFKKRFKGKTARFQKP